MQFLAAVLRQPTLPRDRVSGPPQNRGHREALSDGRYGLSGGLLQEDQPHRAGPERPLSFSRPRHFCRSTPRCHLRAIEHDRLRLRRPHLRYRGTRRVSIQPAPARFSPVRSRSPARAVRSAPELDALPPVHYVTGRARSALGAVRTRHSAPHATPESLPWRSGRRSCWPDSGNPNTRARRMLQRDRTHQLILARLYRRTTRCCCLAGGGRGGRDGSGRVDRPEAGSDRSPPGRHAGSSCAHCRLRLASPHHSVRAAPRGMHVRRRSRASKAIRAIQRASSFLPRSAHERH